MPALLHTLALQSCGGHRTALGWLLDGTALLSARRDVRCAINA
jgi:hypothetical protein